jgi:hypothetical protein
MLYQKNSLRFPGKRFPPALKSVSKVTWLTAYATSELLHACLHASFILVDFVLSRFVSIVNMAHLPKFYGIVSPASTDEKTVIPNGHVAPVL